MAKKSVQLLVVLFCIISIALYILFVNTNNDKTIECSTNNLISCPEASFVAYIDQESKVKILGEPSEEFDFNGWTNIKSLATGYVNIAGIREDNTVVMTGSEFNNMNDIGEWRDIIMVAIGYDLTYGLKEDGTVIYAGNSNEDNSMYLEKVNKEIADWNDITYIAAGLYGVVGVRKSGEVVMITEETILEQEVEQWTNIESVSFEGFRVIGLTKDGKVMVCEIDLDNKIISAYPFHEFEGAIKVCTGRDIIACLMPNGTIKLSKGLETTSEQTDIDRILFDLEYSSVNSASNIIDFDLNLHDIALLKSSGDIIIN